MTSDELRDREIEQGEQWFREVCPDPPAIDVATIKRNVRVAIQEQWLRNTLRDETPSDLEDRTKASVLAAVEAQRRGERAAEQGIPAGRRVPRALRWVGGLGLAAAACLVVYVGLNRSDVDRTIASGDSPYASAFEAYREDELADSLWNLEDDVTQLELAYGVSVWADDEDAFMDDFRDEIDAVMSDDPGGAEWLFDATG